MTREQFAAILRDCAHDPVRFCEAVLDFTPHPGQARWLRSTIPGCLPDDSGGYRPVHRENGLCTGNRFGKSWIGAAKRIFNCAYRPSWSAEKIAFYDRKGQPYRSINAGPTFSQCRIVWDKAYVMLMQPTASWLLKRDAKGKPDVKMTPFPTMTFINGATFEARSTAGDGRHLLGQDYDDINWDEAALEAHFDQILNNVLRMRVIDRDGYIDMTTTPQGPNEFGRYFLDGLAGRNDRLYCQVGSSLDNPHISSELLGVNIEALPDRLRRQNVYGEIVAAGGTFFDGDDLNAATDRELDLHVEKTDAEDREAHAILYVFDEQKKRQIEWVDKYPSHRYVHGWDLADKADWTVGTTWDVSTQPKTLVEFERFNQTGWNHVWSRIRVRHSKYHQGDTYVDSTGVGDVAVDELSDIGAIGVRFTKSSKDEMLTNIQSLLSQRELRMPFIRVLFEEMSYYQREDESLIKDCVMSVAVAGVGMKHEGSNYYFSVVS